MSRSPSSVRLSAPCITPSRHNKVRCFCSHSISLSCRDDPPYSEFQGTGILLYVILFSVFLKQLLKDFRKLGNCLLRCEFVYCSFVRCQRLQPCSHPVRNQGSCRGLFMHKHLLAVILYDAVHQSQERESLQKLWDRKDHIFGVKSSDVVFFCLGSHLPFNPRHQQVYDSLLL